MRSNRWVTVGALVSAIVGLAASLASFVDDLGGLPTFCAESGCETVHASWWARPFGVPMSLLGVLFFATMVVLAFGVAPRLRRWAALAGGLWAMWLIGLQAFEIGAWCKLCMVADPSAIVHAACVLLGAGAVAVRWQRVGAVAVSVGALVFGAAMWTGSPPSLPEGTPACVAKAQVPGVVTIVEFMDFECPYCRAMQVRMDEALAATKHKVRVVRKMVPLEIHKNAKWAAVAYCCAEMQGKGEAMASRMFKLPPRWLTQSYLAGVAVEVGCDAKRYDADWDTAVDQIQADVKDAQAAGIKGLPTMWIGGQAFQGGVSTDEIIAAIDRAAS